MEQHRHQVEDDDEDGHRVALDLVVLHPRIPMEEGHDDLGAVKRRQGDQVEEAQHQVHVDVAREDVEHPVPDPIELDWHDRIEDVEEGSTDEGLQDVRAGARKRHKHLVTIRMAEVVRVVGHRLRIGEDRAVQEDHDERKDDRAEGIDMGLRIQR